MKLIKDKKVFVTGSDGFIGSHLVEALLEKGYQVKALVLYNSFNSFGWLDYLPDDVLKRIEVVPGDVRDSNQMRSEVAGCDAILHLAALIGIPFSYDAPESYIDTNIKGTMNILHAAKDNNVDKVVVVSTSEVYGTAQFVPITEQHPLQPQSPYSATKIAAEQLAMSYFNAFELPVTVLRPFNTFGPRQSARAVIPTVITQIAAGFDEIKLGALHPTRDFNYVTDTVNGMIATMEAENAIGEVINIGTGYDISIQKTVEKIKEIMNSNVNIQLDERRIRPERSEVDRLQAGNEKALSLLDWRPHFVGEEGLEEALEKTVKWFSDPNNSRGYKASVYNK